MLSSTLFSKYPTIAYGGEIVTNITVRLKFQKMVENNMMLFYPYTVKEGERADVIAYNYYGDSNYAWLIYMANNINDPLAEWPRSEEQLKRYIEINYGSIAESQEKIMFYRVEWASDESMLSAAAYSALPSALKKYWIPEFNERRQVIRYTRSKDDWVIETNKVVKLTVSLASDAPTVGSYVYQMTAGSKSASGEVTLVEGSNVYVKHVLGEFLASDKPVYLKDQQIGTCSAAVLHTSPFGTPTFQRNSDGVLFDPQRVASVPPLWTIEENYWAPVTAYEYENEINESKKTIRLIDAGHLDTIERDIRLITS